MKSRLWLALLMLCLGATSCYDDSKLWDELQDHEARIESLETLCSQMNTNITALQTIVTALQSNDHVTAIAPIQEGDTVIGYTITFSKAGSVTIYHGQDGKDGADGTDGQNGEDGRTPAIGVKKATDGLYYWTVDGEWLLDKDGNKVKAVGEDGQDGSSESGRDGVTPKLKIESEYWWVSYDNGDTWTRLGKATAEKGTGACIFKDCRQSENHITLILEDGTEITLNKNNGFGIKFIGLDQIKTIPGTRVEIPYILTGAEGESVIAVICQGYWAAEVIPTDNTSGKIVVVIPAYLIDDEAGVDFGTDTITVTAYNSGRAAAANIKFDLFLIADSTESGVISARAHSISLYIQRSTDYIISIPDDAKSWISVRQPETKAIIEENITLDIADNHTPYEREATIRFLNNDGKEIGEPFHIVQEVGHVLSSQILKDAFAYSHIDTDYNGLISHEEASNATTLEGIRIQGTDEAWTFNEFELFTSVTSIPDNFFWGCTGLKEITLPASLKTIGFYAFDNTSLESIHIPASVTEIGLSAFGNCNITLDENNSSFTLEDGVLYNINKTRIVAFDSNRTGHYDIPETVRSSSGGPFIKPGITSISIPSTWTEIPANAFSYSDLTEITIPNSVTSIGSWAFCGCKNLTSVTLPNALETLPMGIFNCCDKLTSITLPESLRTIENWIFTETDRITELHIPKNVHTISSEAFCYASLLKLTVDPENPYYYSDSYGVYNQDGTELVYLNPLQSEEYVVPENITGLGSIVFKGESLNKVTIHSGVESIKQLALSNSSATCVYMLGSVPPAVTNSIWGNDLKIIVPESAYEAYVASWYNWTQFITYEGMKRWGIYSDSNESGYITNTYMTRYGDYYIVRDVYLYGGTYSFLSDSGERYGVADAELVPNNGTSYNLSADGSGFCVTPGTYDIYLASDLSSFYLMGETWGVVGTFNDWGATHDIPMSQINDDWFAAYNVDWSNCSDHVEFKFRYNEQWGGDFGGYLGSEYFAAIGVIYSTSSSEGSATNIFIAPGVYDIYMSVSRGVFCVMNQGDLPDLDLITK